MSLSGELWKTKVQRLLQEIGDSAAEEEGLAALQATGWDVQAAVRQVKLNQLLRSVTCGTALCFLSLMLLVLCLTPKLEDSPLSAVHDCYSVYSRPHFTSRGCHETAML